MPVAEHPEKPTAWPERSPFPIDPSGPTGFDYMRMASEETLLGADLFRNAPKVKDGFIDAPTAPAVGVERVENPRSIRPVAMRAVGMRAHRDGFAVDQ